MRPPPYVPGAGAWRRLGVGAAELLVALVLFGLVVHGAWRVFAAQRRAAEGLRLRTELLDADRIVRTVLEAELAAGLPGRDWALPEPGVVELRAFRGWGVACPGSAPGDEVVVAYRGLRSPDPEKDSALVLNGSGRWLPAALAARTPLHGEACPGVSGSPAPGAGLERWRLDPAVADPVLARLFERGSYHLRDGSLRYRRGAGGRQPLTTAALDPDGSGLRSGVGDTTALLTVRGAEGRGGGWSRTLRGNGRWKP